MDLPLRPNFVNYFVPQVSCANRYVDFARTAGGNRNCICSSTSGNWPSSWYRPPGGAKHLSPQDAIRSEPLKPGIAWFACCYCLGVEGAAGLTVTFQTLWTTAARVSCANSSLFCPAPPVVTVIAFVPPAVHWTILLVPSTRAMKHCYRSDAKVEPLKATAWLCLLLPCVAGVAGLTVTAKLRATCARVSCANSNVSILPRTAGGVTVIAFCSYQRYWTIPPVPVQL
jgi:hypothetical protein